MKAEQQRRGEVEQRGQRQHKREGKKVGENRDGDGRGAESSDAEDDIPDKDDERGDDEHVRRGHQAARVEGSGLGPAPVIGSGAIARLTRSANSVAESICVLVAG